MTFLLRRALILLLLLAASPYPAIAQRLPGTVIPEHYDLTFDVDLAAARFKGDTRIQVQVAAPTQRVVLNALEMSIEEATITAGGTTQTARAVLDVPTQTATLTVSRPVPAGPAEIRLRYNAALNDYRVVVDPIIPPTNVTATVSTRQELLLNFAGFNGGGVGEVMVEVRKVGLPDNGTVTMSAI